jgi:hypothetical protein
MLFFATLLTLKDRDEPRSHGDTKEDLRPIDSPRRREDAKKRIYLSLVAFGGPPVEPEDDGEWRHYRA